MEVPCPGVAIPRCDVKDSSTLFVKSSASEPDVLYTAFLKSKYSNSHTLLEFNNLKRSALPI